MRSRVMRNIFLLVICIALSVIGPGDTQALDDVPTLFIRTMNLGDGLALDSFGNIYVPDVTRDQIVVFNSGGFEIRRIGSSGTDPGQFLSVADITIDSSNNLYVLDSAQKRVKRFDSMDALTLNLVPPAATNPGEFSIVTDIAVDSAGNIYVLDIFRQKVIEFNAAGAFVEEFGTSGTNPGQFGAPTDMAIDSNDDLYVSDSGRDVIIKFEDADDASVSEFNSVGTGGGAFQIPVGIGIDSSDNVYVTDSGRSDVQIFDSSGSYITVFGASGTGNSSLDNSTEIAIAADGTIYMVDYIRRFVQVFNSSGIFQHIFSGNGLDVPTFKSFRDIGAAPDGSRFYAVDTEDDLVHIFDALGQYQSSFGQTGTTGELDETSGMAVDRMGQVYVLDFGQGVVRVFDENGIHIRDIGGPGSSDGKLLSPSGIDIDQDGNVYVTDVGRNDIQVFDSNGDFARKFSEDGTATNVFGGYPADIALAGNGFVYITDLFDDEVEVFSSDGTHQFRFGTSYGGVGDPANGEFIEPYGISIDVYGRVYVSDFGRHDIQIFDLQGNFLSVLGSNGFGPGEFKNPVGVDWHLNGVLYVADSTGLQTFDNAPYLESITLNTSNGVYGIGEDIQFTLNFSEYVRLNGGGLNIGLNTGDTISFPSPLTGILSADITYTVPGGAYSPNLEIISLAMESGASIVDFTGNPVDLTIPPGQNLHEQGFLPIQGNTPPTAFNDSYYTDDNTTLTINAAAGVLANDHDSDDDSLTAVLLIPPTHGTVTLDPDGAFTYVPTGGYIGGDMFAYYASDNKDYSNVGMAAITVGIINNAAPVANLDGYTTMMNTPLEISPANGVLANDLDAELQPLTATKLTDPMHGQLRFNANGSFSYTPNCGYLGSDAFSYQVTDGDYISNPTLATIQILADPNNQPGDAVPVAPVNLAVDPGQGRPTISWACDPNAEWINVWVGNANGELHYQWYAFDPADDPRGLDLADVKCLGLTCTLKPEIHPTAATWDVWTRTWGFGEYSIGGTTDFDGWSTAQFVLPSNPTGPATNFSTSVTSRTNIRLSWQAPERVTWYYIWISTPAPEWTQQFSGWAQAEDLDCGDGGTCTLRNGVEIPDQGYFNLNLAAGNYTWYVLSWGPAGYSTGGIGGTGWAGGTLFTVP